MKETFGERFSRLRKQKGLKQEDIAFRVNISPQAVSKWENDISSPDISILPTLAEILGVSLDELLGNEKEKPIEMIPEEKRKDIDKMVFKIVVNSADGDKIRVNLPMPLVKLAINSGMEVPQINGNSALKDIDFKKLFELVEQGVVGKLVEVESADGDFIYITVE
ncbi:MAG: helix-turn-helix transcriptional regulator [Bacillales bacterium]|nr:helix-turn-helix transcriptional regulator [Bacillales bacterium]